MEVLVNTYRPHCFNKGGNRYKVKDSGFYRMGRVRKALEVKRKVKMSELFN